MHAGVAQTESVSYKTTGQIMWNGKRTQPNEIYVWSYLLINQQQGVTGAQAAIHMLSDVSGSCESRSTLADLSSASVTVPLIFKETVNFKS